MELTAAEAAVGLLFTTLSGFAGAVMKILYADNKELRQEVRDANKASRDLIAVQAAVLRK